MTGVLTKKGKYYYVIVDEGVDIHGSRKQKWISTKCKMKSEAKKELSRILSEMETDDYIDPCRYTLNMFFEEYKRKFVKEVAQTTLEGYTIIIDNHILKYFDNSFLLADLTPKILDDYFTYYLNRPTNPLSSQTLKRHKAVFKRALGYATEMKMIKENPVYAIRLPKVKKSKIRVYSASQISQLLKLVKGDIIEPGVTMSVYFALRRGEAVGLRWLDIDLEKQMLTIQNTITKVSRTIEKGPKSETSLHEFNISARVDKYLLDLKERQEKDRLLCGNSYIESGYVMKYPNGSSVSCSTYNRRFKLLLEKNSMPHIRLHDIRHSMASIIHKSTKMSLYELMDFMRHANLSTTERYVHIDSESNIRIASIVDDCLPL